MEVDEERYEPPSNVTMDEAADEWLVSLRRRSTTQRQYATTLTYARAVFGPRRLRQVTALDVLALLRHIEEESAKRRGGHKQPDSAAPGVSEATLAKHLRQLSVFFEAARRRGLISENPVRRLDASAKPRSRRKRPSYFTDGELARLWPELAERPAYLHAMKLAATTGMRFGEIAGLRLTDLSLSAREIQLERQFTGGEEVDTPKDREPRTVDLVPAAVEVLEEWLRLRGPSEEGLLFEREIGGHLANDEDRDLLYGAMRRAGIERLGERGGRRDVLARKSTVGPRAHAVAGRGTTSRPPRGSWVTSSGKPFSHASSAVMRRRTTACSRCRASGFGSSAGQRRSARESGRSCVDAWMRSGAGLVARRVAEGWPCGVGWSGTGLIRVGSWRGLRETA